MPEIKNTFTQGKMNKDLDERIIPNGQYRDAMNVQVSTSDGANIGAVQNILGNTPLNTVTREGGNVQMVPAGWECVGSVSDEKNNSLYSFITNNIDSAIIEYTKVGTITPIMVDIGNNILKFNMGDIITGINIVESLLFWTDGKNEPKKINIESFKVNAHTDLSTHSKLVVEGVIVTDSSGIQIDIEEEHITVIRKNPLKKLSVKINPAEVTNKNPLFKKIFPRFSYRYRYNDGEYSAYAPFTDVVFNSLYPVDHDGELHNNNSAYSDKEPYNSGMINMVQSIELSDFISPNIPLDVVQIDLLYKQEDSNVVYVMEIIKKSDVAGIEWVSNGFNSASAYKGKFTVTSENIYAAIPSNQLLRPWDNVPKKALAQEITGNRVVYGNYTQNYTDNFFPKLTSDYTVRQHKETLFTPDLYGNIITNYNFLNNADGWDLGTDVTYNASDQRIDFGSSGTPAPWPEKMIYLNNDGWGPAGTVYRISFDVINWQQGNIGIRLTNGILGTFPPGDYIQEDIDLTAQSLSQGDNFHFTGDFTMIAQTNPAAALSSNGRFWIQSSFGGQGVDEFEGSIDNVEILQISTPEDQTIYVGEGGLPSVKSQRNYQVGVVYGDKYGRESPVFTSTDSSLVIPFEDITRIQPLASYPLQIKASINSDHPNWASYYKFYVKETSGEYYNLVMDALYTPTRNELDEEEHVWLSFASSDRNKISVDDYIILKRKIGDSQILEDNKFRVLDVQNEAPEAIKYKYEDMGRVENALQTSISTDLKDSVLNASFANNGLFHNHQWLPFNDNEQNKFALSNPSWNSNGGSKLYNGSWDNNFPLEDDLYFSFSKESGIYDTQNSRKYKIVEAKPQGSSSPYYMIKLDRAISDIDNDIWARTSTAGDAYGVGGGPWPHVHIDCVARIEKKIPKDLELFSGRFFVKIVASALIKNELKFLENVANPNYIIEAQQNLYWHADVDNNTDNQEYRQANNDGGLLNNEYNGTYPSSGTVLSVTGATKPVTVTTTAWGKLLTEMQGISSPTSFFIDNMAFLTGQLGAYAREGGYPFNGGEPQILSDITYHCDVGQVPAGREYYIDSGSGKVMSWGTNYQENVQFFNNPNNQNDLTLPNTYRINGLDGIATVTSDHTDTDGIRRWKNSNFDSTLDNTYSTQPGKFYLHLSFLAPGGDLHDGTFPNTININTLHNHLQGIHGGGVFTSLPDSTIPHSFNFGTNPDFLVGGASNSVYNQNPNNPSAILMEKPDANATGVKYTASTDSNGSYCAIPVGGHNEDYQILHDRQWDPTFPSDPGGLINDFIANLKPGRKFKFKGDTSTDQYGIRSVQVKKLYNAYSWKWAFENYWQDQQRLRLTGRSVEQKAVKYSSSVDANGENGNAADQTLLENRIVAFGSAKNRRLVYILELDTDPKQSGTFNPTNGSNINSVTYDAIQFVTEDPELLTGEVSQNPAIWETEPKDNVDLDIYYEASQAYPVNIDFNTRELFSQIGCRVEILDLPSARQGALNIYNDVVLVSFDINEAQKFTLYPGFNYYESDGTTEVDYSNAKIKFIRDDGSYTTTKLEATMESQVAGDYRTDFRIVSSAPVNSETGLSWYNCFMFGNGVESNRIRDDFNAMTISNGVRASSTLDRPYEEEHKKHGLIYSGIYSSRSGMNNLNQFIMAEKITKDLNPTYGSIQKLFQRRSSGSHADSLIAFCEDRVVNITSDKDAIYNADGKPQIVASNAVLGDANPFVGEWGISKNPESFAKESYRAYFTDKQRGVVLRLSMDGLTPISEAGMTEWFKDEFKGDHYNIIGSYDNYKNDYNLTLDDGSGSVPGSKTLSFSEDVRGWVSFKSFILESGISMGGDYYTFKNGICYKHHDNESRNLFYEDATSNSSVTFIFNESPSVIKNFNTLNYDGDSDWFCENIVTDQQSGTITQFIEKEGRWFNYIKGDINAAVDINAFNFQGIGTASNITYNI